MILGHIGARKGSKGVVGKNFRKIAGKPLIDWSLDQLIQNSQIDAVLVSTDDEEIYRHCTRKGTLDIGLRPASLATDDASKWDVWKYSLETFESQYGKVDAFVDLDCTSPLRSERDICGALSLYFEKKPDMVMSCCEARKNPYFNLVEEDNSGGLMVSKQLPSNIVARQHAPTVYEHAASLYVVKPEYLKKADFLFDGRVIPFIMPNERCLDIDSELDFKLVEYLMEEKYCE